MARKEMLDALRHAQDRAQATADAILIELRRQAEEGTERDGAISGAPPAEPDVTPFRTASERT